MQRLRFPGCLIAALLLAGCQTVSDRTVADRQAAIESDLALAGLSEDPAIEAARERVMAATALEESEVAFDSVELRGALVHERDEKAQVLARLPLRNPFELAEQRKARGAERLWALARLEEASLAVRVERCVPSLLLQSYVEREDLFERYREQMQRLLAWNEELHNAGLINELAAVDFDLSARVKLATRSPIDRARSVGVAGSPPDFDVLPRLDSEGLLLETDASLLRQQVLRHQPSILAHRASRARYEALARRENMKRIPTPRFVDLGFEPVAFPGDDRQIEARIAFEIPFGRSASAQKRHYEALARSESSAEAHSTRVLEREAAEALSTINDFRARTGHWSELEGLAEKSDSLVDRWMRNRLSSPGDVANLIDSGHEARLAVVEARERAGRAACAIVAATGVTVAEWPEQAGDGAYR